MDKQRFTYKPVGVCASRIVIEMAGLTIADVKVENGCNGNAQGLASLLQGMAIEDAIWKLDGICCGSKPTSCPDQIAQALRKWLQTQK